jgi:hypothetical protein
MILIIEGIFLCGIFTLIIIPPLYKNPLGQIMSYPTKIRKRVEELPEYRNNIKTKEKKQITKKICVLILCVVIFTIIAYFSGARTFLSAFAHTFILFFIVNIYDLIILDVIIFCNSKKVIIKGTEDMIKEYKIPVHHIRRALLGICFGTIVAVMSGGVMILCG